MMNLMEKQRRENYSVMDARRKTRKQETNKSRKLMSSICVVFKNFIPSSNNIFHFHFPFPFAFLHVNLKKPAISLIKSKRTIKRSLNREERVVEDFFFINPKSLKRKSDDDLSSRKALMI